MVFSNVILDEDQPVICHTFGELKKKYSLEGNTSAYDLYSSLLTNTKTAFNVNEDGEQIHNKLVLSDQEVKVTEYFLRMLLIYLDLQFIVKLHHIGKWMYHLPYYTIHRVL